MIDEEAEHDFEQVNVVIVTPVVREADSQALPLHADGPYIYHHHDLLLPVDANVRSAPTIWRA